MPWHVGPLRERVDTPLSNQFLTDWHQLIVDEAADSATRWRLDAYITSVSEPITIADTFIDEWLEGLWRTDHK